MVKLIFEKWKDQLNNGKMKGVFEQLKERLNNKKKKVFTILTKVIWQE